MGTDVLKKFGRYFLLDRVAQGGMAEIYRARLSSTDGAGRILVIKRIQAAYGTNKEFLQMFKSEIRVTMGFSHPNIVQVFDFGEENDQPYIAMEFVDGKNIRHLTSRAKERQENLPIEISAHIIEQAASGLHYAHSFRDKITGEALDIVHRDISPQNIIVSYDGAVKLIDFGIAKATVNTESTRAGVIKGKPSYLSPEQINGERLDARSDVFALSVVLWEMLTGKKLFAASSNDNEFAVLKLIESCDTYVKPPSAFNSNVPKELDLITLRALAKDREKRFQTSEEFAKALRRFLTGFAPDVGTSEASYFLKSLFKDEIVKDRKKLQDLNAKAETLLASEMNIVSGYDNANLNQLIDKAPDGTRTVRTSGSVNRFDGKKLQGSSFGVEFQTGSGLQGASETTEASATDASPEPVQRKRKIRTFESRAPQQRSGSTQKTKSGGGFLKIILIPAAAIVAVVLYGKDFGLPIQLPKKIECRIQGNCEPQVSVAKTEPKVEEPVLQEAAVEFQVYPPVSPKPSIVVNGQTYNGDRVSVQVEIGKPVNLIVSKTGFKTMYETFTLDKNLMNGGGKDVHAVYLEPVTAFGSITLNAFPLADVVIKRIEQDREIASPMTPKPLTTPVEEMKLPIGHYRVIFRNELLDVTEERRVTIEEDKTVRLKVDLKIH